MSERGLPPIPSPAELASRREADILAVLRSVASGSRMMRLRAVEALNRQGFTDDEITSALRAETVRLREDTERINAMKLHLMCRGKDSE
jgi:hypothetical protein